MMKFLFRALTASFLALTLSLTAASQTAQQIHFLSFAPAPTDLSGQQHQRTDSDGNPYALVKVTLSSDPTPEGIAMLREFTYKFGMLSSEIDATEHPDGLWIYVKKNAKSVTITRQGYNPVTNQDLGCTLQSAQTYHMQLSFDGPTVKKQWLIFQVSPADAGALLKVRAAGQTDYEMWGAASAEGSLSRNLPCGRYEYVAWADNYLETEGVVELSTPNGKFTETVTLQPNFGYLSIPAKGDNKGAQAIVDNKVIGTLPFNDKTPFSVGTHTLTIVKGENFKPFTTTFTIRNGETTEISADLQSNTADITLKAGEGVDIYIDGQKKGNGTWSGLLREGSYTVECRKENHEPVQRSLTVSVGIAQTITLDAPKPITGLLAIESTPMDATVLVDGVKRGTTPMTIDDLLIGTHQVVLQKPNYQSSSFTVNIEKGKMCEKSVTLSSVGRFVINSHPAGATLYLNGERKGVTPFNAEMASGDYRLRLEKSGCKTLDKDIHLDLSHSTQTFTLKQMLLRKSAFYLQPSFLIGSFPAYGGAVGCYIGGFNIEAHVAVGQATSETIYWNYNGQNGDTYDKEVFQNPLLFGGSLGYGIIVDNNFRFTPQAGVRVTQVSGEYSSFYATSGLFGVRAEWAPINHLSLAITPAYQVLLSPSTTWKQISAVSPIVNSWASGFRLQAGICLFF